MEDVRPTGEPTPKRRTVTQGIRQDRSGYEAYVKVAGIQVARRFSSRTPIRVMRVWREQTRAGLLSKHRPRLPSYPIEPILPKHAPPLPKSPDGWCYVYFVQDGGNVKIGRAVDPVRRLAKLQTAHHRKLTLVCAVPGHCVLEAAIQLRFKHLQQEGEWFRIDADMVWFIEQLNAGKNPIALIWDEKLCTVSAGTPVKPGPN